MARRFDGRVVWITGASSGIGEALAEAFAREGAQLILSARRRAELERVAARCGGDPMVVPLDLERPESFGPLVETVHRRFPRIDIVVHNGGISQRALAKDTDLEVDQRIMAVNYLGTVGLTKALLPSMLKARSGHLVVVTSVMGKIGTPQRSAYAASKHALHGFFDCLRAEVSSEGLDVTLICPGFVRTNIATNALTGDGSPRSRSDDDVGAGHPPDLTARQILDAVSKKKSEAYVGAIGKELLALLMKRAAPRILERMVRGAAPR